MHAAGPRRPVHAPTGCPRASGGSRTHNPRITNAVLCQLKLRWQIQSEEYPSSDSHHGTVLCRRHLLRPPTPGCGSAAPGRPTVRCPQKTPSSVVYTKAYPRTSPCSPPPVLPCSSTPRGAGRTKPGAGATISAPGTTPRPYCGGILAGRQASPGPFPQAGRVGPPGALPRVAEGGQGVRAGTAGGRSAGGRLRPPAGRDGPRSQLVVRRDRGCKDRPGANPLSQQEWLAAGAQRVAGNSGRSCSPASFSPVPTATRCVPAIVIPTAMRCVPAIVSCPSD